jgi:hypothetical protein
MLCAHHKSWWSRFCGSPQASPESPGINGDLLKALRSDVVGRCRKLISACRHNGQRQLCYRQAIAEFNSATNGENLPLLALIFDVLTRWSATYNMISRYLIMKDVSSVPYCAFATAIHLLTFFILGRQDFSRKAGLSRSAPRSPSQ